MSLDDFSVKFSFVLSSYSKFNCELFNCELFNCELFIAIIVVSHCKPSNVCVAMIKSMSKIFALVITMV